MGQTVFQSIHPDRVLEAGFGKGFTKRRILNFYKLYYQKMEEILPETYGINRNFVRWLRESYSFPTLKVVSSQKDSEGNVKIGYQTHDGYWIEAVILAREDETSICISTQVGCKMGCAFCATGKLGFTRNLETWEIVEQVRLAKVHFLQGRELTHITIMGMGEPFENFENMYDAFLTFTHPFTYMLGASKVTVASAGYLPGLRKLLEKQKKPSLVISLHAPNQEIREKLLPISKTYSMEEVLDFIRSYPLKKNKRISVQYLLLKGINDGPEHADELGKLLQGLPVKINFMRYNRVEGLGLEPVEEPVREYFIERLREYGFSCIRRRSAGEEISAACGQLGLERKRFQENLCYQ
jgi:23S rRNA (adenine2503-C2)-methyltransferase